MSKLELLKVETDTAKTYRPSDSFLFKLTFNNQTAIEDDVEFEVTYFGDAYSENHDQKICHNIIGPLQAGKLYFELETSKIDLTQIPIKTLFGLTTILIAGKFKGEQFVRIGYVVNVKYPGVEAEKLLDSDDAPLEGQEEVEEEEEEEESYDGEDEIEVMDDEELEDDEQNCDAQQECCGEEEEELCCSKENCDCDNEPCCSKENCDCDYKPCCSKENCDCDQQYGDGLEDALAQALMPKNNRKPIPLETPIVADKDEFEYKGIPMKQSMIELTFLEKPIIHVFDIDWDSEVAKETDNVVVSSENENNTPESQLSKRSKIQ